MNTERKHSKILRRFFTSLEKRLKRFKKTRPISRHSSSEVEPPTSSNSGGIEPLNREDDFERRRLELYERCESNIVELRRLCRNYEGFNENTTITSRSHYRNELKRAQLIGKLRKVEAEQRRLLKEIATKRRELKLLKTSDLTVRMRP